MAGMAAVLSYTSEASTILAFLVLLPGAIGAVRKQMREHRRCRYRPRHGRGARHRLMPPRAMTSAEAAPKSHPQCPCTRPRRRPNDLVGTGRSVRGRP
jgi:hypothetical protein